MKFANANLLTCLFALMVCSATGYGDENNSDLFATVAEIFSKHCVACHNEIDQEGGFSLEAKEAFFDSGHVEPRQSDSSLMDVLRPDGDQPPSMPKDGTPLTQTQLAAIEKWIAAGAEWPSGVRIEATVSDFDWWSFKPMIRPAIPGSEDHPIDAFVQATLREKGLAPSRPADRRTLIRRLTYDLTGLPPTPAEINAFVNDSSDAAYDKLVDRLLESPRYGERWARHWLDVVKYADTCGYDKDKLRPNAWPYRDYVIRSLNEDKLYARFVQEQIAGDVLFPGERDGIIGLGFIAAGPWDFIGHVEVPESKIDGKVARNLDRDEMVTNTLNTFCSVTIQCARCHNHKFDPFTQEHYYSLQAIFAAVDRAERVYDLDPKIVKQKAKLESQLTDLRTQKKAVEKERSDAAGERLVKLDQQIKELKPQVGIEKKPAFGYHSEIVKEQAATKWVQVDLGRQVDVARVVLFPCHDEYAGIGAGFGFPVRYKIETTSDDPSLPTATWTILEDRTDSDQPNPGYLPVTIETNETTARFVRVTATKLAPRSNDFIFALAELHVLDAGGRNAAENAKVTSLDSIQAPVRWHRNNLVDGLFARPKDHGAATTLVSVQRERGALVARIETEDWVRRRDAIEAKIRKHEEELSGLPAGKMVYAAATSFKPQGNFKPTGGKPRTVRILHRGNITQPLDEVTAGVLPTAAENDWRLASVDTESERRAALARWLTDDANPLVWRSIVNRVWQHHFGSGIVDTPNDFGRMGSLPTHPELLDWLAVEFRDNGQSLKSLHRLIVTSKTYKQSSASHLHHAKIDAGNQFLWRMNRRRLTAEEIRDSILTVSGSLNEQMGGPGFYLFELERTEHSPHYEYHKFDPRDEASHRRSIYRFVVRSQPDPFMTTLDCADSSQSTPRRNETLTSLQALSLLNNRFNLVMAERFAADLSRDRPSLAEQIDHAMLRVAGRLPAEDERAELVDYAKRHGMQNLCRMLFNLSEFVFID